MLYLVKSGCQWSMLPSDFPKWNVVYFYFQIWSKKEANEDSILEKALKELVVELRTKEGNKAKTSMLILDAQSVKNTDTAKKGYDGGKKVSGTKRDIALDSQGLSHAIAITKANETDRKGAISMINPHSAPNS